MNITIDDLNGNTVDVDMRYVGAVYEDDDVIYFGGTPFRLSSARPAISLTPGSSGRGLDDDSAKQLDLLAAPLNPVS